MSMKYVDITIIRNIEEESIFRTLGRHFGYENITTDEDTIIMTFDDGTICDTKDEYVDKKYKFGALGHDFSFPIYLDIESKDITLFYQNPFTENSIRKINLNPLFENRNKNCRQASEYNMTYEDNEDKQVFAICRIKSNEEKPRFMLAYDDTIFDKSDIIYLTDRIFKQRFNQ